MHVSPEQWAHWERELDASARVPPEHWRDVPGPTADDDVNSLFMHIRLVEDEREPAAMDAMCRELGYEDYWHYRRRFWTMAKIHGEGGPLVSNKSLFGGKLNGFMMAGTSLATWWKAERALRIHPHLLEPIDGMTLERWAEIHTLKVHEAATPLPAILGRFELDVTTWERIDAAWSKRLAEDDIESGLARRFRMHQADKSPGRFATTGRATARAMAGDPMGLRELAPFPRERWTQLMIDMQGWMMSGVDSADAAERLYGLTPGDMQDCTLYWNTRFAIYGDEMMEHNMQLMNNAQGVAAELENLDDDLRLGSVFENAAGSSLRHLYVGGTVIAECTSCGAPQREAGAFGCPYCGERIEARA